MKFEQQFFLEIAKQFASQSTCCRKQVGAILVKDGRIVSTGYNGVVKGAIHCNEHDVFKNVDWTKQKATDDLAMKHHQFSSVNELHAEQNAIAFAAKNGVSTDGCTLYTTLAPCPDCAKLIVASGIKEVYYTEEYDRNTTGINFLKKCAPTASRFPVHRIYMSPLHHVFPLNTFHKVRCI